MLYTPQNGLSECFKYFNGCARKDKVNVISRKPESSHVSIYFVRICYYVYAKDFMIS